MRTINYLLVSIIVLGMLMSVWAQPQQKQTGKSSEATELSKKIRRFAPTVMTANTARLSPSDRKALQKIIAAAKLYDQLYLRQIWSGNEALLQRLQADKTALGRLRLHYFMINKGPWSQLDENEPFIDGVPTASACSELLSRRHNQG